MHNPATGDVVGEAPLCGEDDLRSAVEAAGEALADWSAKNPRDRAKILFFAAEEVRRRNTELGSLLTAEQGKPIREAVDEINGFANILEYYYALSAGERGEYQNLRGYGHTLVERRPLGICGAIIPWNMPAIIMGWKIGPALVAGNTVVLKPAQTTPLTCGKLAEILAGAGLPSGVLNVVTGPGETVGREIARDLDIHLVIHMDPLTMDDPAVLRLRDMTAKIVSEIDASLSMHDFRVVKGVTHTNLIFDIVIPYQCPKKDPQVIEEITQKIKEKEQSLYAVITIDRFYV